nr:nucleotidyltransferase family protein [Sulfobacillus harzensis]
MAGQTNQGQLKALSTAEYEAEIVVGGRPMVDWVLEALKSSPSITSVGMVGPVSLSREGVQLAPMTGDLFQNILQGLATAPENADKVLFVTSDIPWLTPAVVEAFLKAAPDDVDVVYPVIPKEAAERRFPGTKRTYVRLKDVTVTGGNLFLARASAVPRLKERAEVLLAHRKAPLQLARDVGFGLLLRLLTGQLSLTQAETRVGGLLGIRGRAVIFPYAEAGVDVDKPEDLALAERELGEPGHASGQGWSGL